MPITTQKSGLVNTLEIGKMLSMSLLLFSIFASGCMKVKSAPASLLETRPIPKTNTMAKALKEGPAKPSKVEKKPENKGPLPQKDQKHLEDPRMDAVMERFQKAVFYLQQEKIEKARILFETLRDNHPGVSVFHNNLGVIYKRLGRFDEAVHAYRQAIVTAGQNSRGSDPAAYYNLGIALREQGAFKKAEDAYQKAIALSPGFEDAHFNLAVLYDLYLDDPGRALFHYQQQIELSNKKDKEIEIWIAVLKKRLAVAGSQP